MINIIRNCVFDVVNPEGCTVHIECPEQDFKLEKITSISPGRHFVIKAAGNIEANDIRTFEHVNEPTVPSSVEVRLNRHERRKIAKLRRNSRI